MKRIIILIILLPLLLSCIGIGRQQVKVVEMSTAYNQSGINKSYHIDSKKRKVISYIAPVESFENLLQTTPIGKIDKIIRDNPGYEFIFYCDRLSGPGDTLKMKELLKRYGCRFTVYMDFNDEFYNANKPLFTGLAQRWNKISYICDEKNRILDVATIGTKMSVFDQVFRKYR